MDYWDETIAEAFAEFGIEATQDQVFSVSAAVENAHNCYGIYTQLKKIQDDKIKKRPQGVRSRARNSEG